MSIKRANIFFYCAHIDRFSRRKAARIFVSGWCLLVAEEHRFCATSFLFWHKNCLSDRSLLHFSSIHALLMALIRRNRRPDVLLASREPLSVAAEVAEVELILVAREENPQVYPHTRLLGVDAAVISFHASCWVHTIFRVNCCTSVLSVPRVCVCARENDRVHWAPDEQNERILRKNLNPKEQETNKNRSD